MPTNRNLKLYNPQITLGMSVEGQRPRSKGSTGGPTPKHPRSGKESYLATSHKGRGMFHGGADIENSDSDDMEILIEQDLAMHDLNGKKMRLRNEKAKNGHQNGIAQTTVKRRQAGHRNSAASQNSSSKYKESELDKEKHAEADLIENFGLVIKHINDLKEKESRKRSIGAVKSPSRVESPVMDILKFKMLKTQHTKRSNFNTKELIKQKIPMLGVMSPFVAHKMANLTVNMIDLMGNEI
jgi:hypothetical protein